MNEWLCQILLELLHEAKTKEQKQEHLKTRRKLTDIANCNELEKLLQSTVLDREEYDVVKLKTNTRKTFVEIGEELHMSERTARRRYKTALNKIQANI